MAPTGRSLRVELHSPLPQVMYAPSEEQMYVSGIAVDGERPVSALTILVDGNPHPVEAIGMARFDVPERRGGFWATVPVRIASGARSVELAAEATGRDGRRERMPLASVAVMPAASVPIVTTPPQDTEIAICMATYRPDPKLLRAQVESIRAQTDTHWSCVISDDWTPPGEFEQILAIVGDDPRFTVSRSERWIGVYRNFERALMLAPPAAGLLAPCDQDDVWHPDKLATLRSAIGDASLAYSDQRLADADGRILRDTMWVGRTNNSGDLASMLVANAVTGAAMLIRRDVVARALPFPEFPGVKLHDHWLTLVALASRPLHYVDRPLYDYVQHPNAILGRVMTERALRRRRRWRAPRLHEWRGAYFLGYLPSAMRAQTLAMRCADTLTPSQADVLRRYVAAETSLPAFLWLVSRPLRMLLGHTETRGAESELAVGIVWRQLARISAGLPGVPDRLLVDTSFPAVGSFVQRRLGRWRQRIG